MENFKNHPHSQQQQQRLVLFAGPHKSASSSVQEFFMRYASNRKPKHPALVNWTWPFNVRRRSYLPRKGFAPLVVEYEDEGFRQLIYETIMYVWNGTDAPNKRKDANGGLIFGSEEFDRFGDAPWSHRNGMLAIRDILQLTNPADFEIVVNYRTPRHELWISIWKQLTRTAPIPYREYLCKEDDDKTWEYLDAVANPLGLVHAFRANQWKVTLIDMEGVANDKMDVAHVVACEVLKVPCTNGWLEGLDQILQNKKSEMSQEELDRMEWILRQRDCAYRDELEKDDGVKILHKLSLWDGCNPSSSKNMADFRNTTFLLQLLRAQMGCGGDESVNKNITGRMADSTQSLRSPQTDAVQLKGASFEVHQNVEATTAHLVEVAKWQQRLVFMLGMTMIVFLARMRRKGSKGGSRSKNDHAMVQIS